MNKTPNPTRLKCLLLSVILLVTLALPALASDTDKLSDEPITYTVLTFEHSNQPQPSTEDHIVARGLFEKTNVQLDFEIVPDSEFKTKVNLLLASNQMPDIITTNTSGSNYTKTYATSGIFLNLSDYLEEYAPYYYENYYSVNPNIWMYDIEGGTYAFVKTRSPEDSMKAWSLFMRVDLLEEYGIDSPETMDDVLDVCAQLKEIFPDSYPLTGRSSTNLMKYGSFMLGSGWSIYWDTDLETWLYGQATETFKVVLEWMNKAWDMGVLDIDYATMNNQLWQEKLTTGSAFVTIDNMMWASNLTPTLQATTGDPDAVLAVVNVPTNDVYGTARAMRFPSPEDKFVMLSADIENPEIAIAFIDYCYSQEGADICNYGIEGETFYYDENGEPQYLEEFVQQYADSSAVYYAVRSALGGNELGWCLTWEEDATEQKITQLLGEDMNRAWYIAQDILTTDDGFKDTKVQPPLTEEEQEIVADILNAVSTYLAPLYDEFITGERDIDEWDDVIAELPDMGIEQVVQIYNDAYDRILAEKGLE